MEVFGWMALYVNGPSGNDLPCRALWIFLCGGRRAKGEDGPGVVWRELGQAGPGMGGSVGFGLG